MNQLKWFDPKNQTKKKKDYFKLVYLVNRFWWVGNLTTYAYLTTYLAKCR
jgi:hypothetical protein